MKKAFSLLIILSFLFSCSGNKKITKAESSFPVYGNYCGPLYPPKGSNPVPVDKVDLACKNHDKCYGDLGYFNKDCDLQIMQDLKVVKPKSEKENLAKKLLIFYFQEASKI
jgi:hypothetical protein